MEQKRGHIEIVENYCINFGGMCFFVVSLRLNSFLLFCHISYSLCGRPCAGRRGSFFCLFLNILRLKSPQKHQKMQKNEKKCKKNAKKFAHIKKKLYLCTGFQNKEIENTKKKPKKETKL